MDCPIDIRTSPRTPMPASEQQMIEEFWRTKQEEIEAIEDFGERAIPMTRLKKVICAEKGKMMMTFDTPSFLTKACEMFVQELTFCAWMCASSHHRGIILDSDIAEAIASMESYDFLNDLLHAYQNDQNSVPRPKPTKKRHKSTDQPSTSCHPHLHQFQVPQFQVPQFQVPQFQTPQFHVPQFSPQFVGYPPYVRIPLLVPPTNFHRMPLPLPFLPQETPPLMATTVRPTPIVGGIIPPINHMARGLGFFGNNINTTTNNNTPSNFAMSNNVAASCVMAPPLQACAGAIPNVPNTYCFMNLTSTSATAAVYGAGGASASNLAAQDGGVPFHFPYNPPVALQFPSLPEMANSSTGPTASTGNTIHASGAADADADADADANHDVTVGVDDGPQQHQENETTADNCLNAADGSLDAVVAAANSPAENNLDIDWDDFHMPDDSLLSQFWEDIMMDEDPVLLPNATSTENLPLTGDIQDLEGFGHEPYLLDNIVSVASTSSRRSEMN
ncbi:uncharacterized protein LOC133904587 [Phragmites australis]|uniref:uncharacterized protein LOC133904587 n=1 Tax=Phragmites australis TaxID=29695 RepID=UPI002D785DD0|nr:uncharacterized protein LOC133904587 [Phragmites australis]